MRERGYQAQHSSKREKQPISTAVYRKEGGVNLRTSSARAEKNLGPELQFDGNSRPQLLTRAATATAATTAIIKENQ